MRKFALVLAGATLLAIAFFVSRSGYEITSVAFVALGTGSLMFGFILDSETVRSNTTEVINKKNRMRGVILATLPILALIYGSALSPGFKQVVIITLVSVLFLVLVIAGFFKTD